MSTPIGKGKRVSISPFVNKPRERTGKFTPTKTKKVLPRHRASIIESMKKRNQFKRQSRKRTINTLEGEIKKYNTKLVLLPEGNEKNKVQHHINAIKEKLDETRSKYSLSKNLNNNYKLPNWFSSSNDNTEPPSNANTEPGTQEQNYEVEEVRSAANAGGRRHTRRQHTKKRHTRR